MSGQIRIIPHTVNESRSAMDFVKIGAWIVLAAGLILLFLPLVLNIAVALGFIATGIALLKKRIQGDVTGLVASGVLVTLGILTLVWPTLLNYFVIIPLLIFHGLVNTWMFYWGYRTWAWIYLGVAVIVGTLLVVFPTILNYLLSIYLIIAGGYLLAWRWRLQSFMK